MGKDVHQFINKKDYNIYKNIITKLNNKQNLFEILNYCRTKEQFKNTDLKICIFLVRFIFLFL